MTVRRRTDELSCREGRVAQGLSVLLDEIGHGGMAA
jgi:hypothetical protein